jgi:hypothetical protein
MPTNLLLFPLLGGFLFVHSCYFFRFRAQRLDGYRLLLESAFFGLLLSVPARLITYYWPRYFEAGRSVRTEWGYLWRDAPLSGTATLSLLLGLVAPVLINWLHAFYLRVGQEPWRFYSAIGDPGKAVNELLKPARERALDLAIESSGNYLHQLLHSAVLKNIPILITLASRKVYVGYLTESPNLKPENQHLALLPVLSGYRDKDTLRIKLDLIYPNPKSFTGEDIDPEDLLLMTVPFSEIKSASFYHQDQQHLFQSYPSPDPNPAAEPLTED